MVDGFAFGMSKFRSLAVLSRCLFIAVIFVSVIRPITQLDALSTKHHAKRDVDKTAPCDRNPKIGIPIDLQVSPNKINVALTYKETDFPFRPFELMLFEGDSSLDCQYIRCAKHADEWRYINGTSSVYDGLKPGHYCAYLKYRHFGEVCNYRSITQLVQSPSNHTSMEQFESSPPKWIYIALGVSSAIAVIFFSILLYMCRKKPEKVLHFTDKKKLISFHEAINTKIPATVFLLYNSDCNHHMKVVMKLAEFLEQNNCKVSCEYKDKHEIVVNKVSWIHERLSSNFKILLVNSKMAFVKQKLWLKYRDSNEMKAFEDDMFIHALATISHRCRQMLDYKNLFMLLPSYVSKEFILKDICPGKQYEFPRYLAVLLCHLHEVNNRIVDIDEPGMSWEHCATAYDELQLLVNSMIAYDDQGNLTTGCKLCDPQVKSKNMSDNLINM